MPENSWQRPMGTYDTNCYLDDKRDSMTHVWYRYSFCIHFDALLYFQMLYLIEVSTKFANQISTQPRALNRPCIMDTVSELANSRLTLLHVDIAQKERRCRYFARLILYLGFGFTKSCIFFQVFASFICLPDNPLQ